jgi:ribonuclease HI
MKDNDIIYTNNELEYLALEYGLKYINNNYPKKKVVLYSDSMLIVNQVNGKWRITTKTLLPLCKRCLNLLGSNVSIRWIKRDMNKAGWVLEDLLLKSKTLKDK